MGKNVELPHPSNGGTIYGIFPKVRHAKLELPAGDIVLRYGEQRGYHRGFGFMHIWHEHYGHIARQDDAIVAVCAVVASIIRPGAAIHDEGNGRALILKTPTGVVIVELNHRGDNTPFYSVVTCFDGRKTHGPRVGAVVEVSNPVAEAAT